MNKKLKLKIKKYNLDKKNRIIFATLKPNKDKAVTTALK